MRICYLGPYNRNYSRNSIILKGLRLNNVEVEEINYRSTYLNYLKSILNRYKLKYDVIIIGYAFYRGLENLLTKLSSRKPIVWDAYFSQYENLVLNWKLIDMNSLKARILYNLELIDLKCANCVILDTNAHINYFKKLYPIKNVKYGRVFIGADDTIAFPKNFQNESDKFIVFFSGFYNPLHGIEYILKAAKDLQNHKEILFQIVGGGKTLEYFKKLRAQWKLSNLKLIPPQPYLKTIALMNRADVCLGIFGVINKTNNVIPNKVYDALAIAKPLITCKSDAILEILEDKTNCLLCKRGNGKSLAESILLLKEEDQLRKKIASNAYKLFKKRFTPKHIGRSLIENITNFI